MLAVGLADSVLSAREVGSSDRLETRTREALANGDADSTSNAGASCLNVHSQR